VVECRFHIGESCLVHGLALELLLVLDPGMSECLVGGEALVHILDDKALEELLRFWCVLLERLVIEMEVALDDVTDNLEF